MWTSTYRASPPGGATPGSVRGRGADVAGRIGSRLAPPVDGLELLLRVIGKDEVVVQQMVVAPVQPEVEHDAGTGRFVAAPALEARGRLASEQLAMSPHGIGVGYHRIERDVFARLRLNAPDTAIARLENSPHPCSGSDLDAQLGRESGQCPRHGPRASQGIPDSLTGLHVGDAAKYRGRCVRSRAHILGEMIEHLGNARVRAHASAPSRPPTARVAGREGRATETVRRWS